MLVTTAQLMRQQLILRHLGFYEGPIDGLWGPASIAGKAAFERSSKFSPGIPNGGLPFATRPPYPASFYISTETRELSFTGLEISITQEMVESAQASLYMPDDSEPISASVEEVPSKDVSEA